MSPAQYPGATGGGIATEADPIAVARLDALGLTFATDAELNAAVTTLQAADALKQDASTAATDAELAAARAAIEAAMATDAELASAVATLQAADALKQDAATAATDAELASGLAGKQDAATAATDAELSAAVAGLLTPAQADARYVTRGTTWAPKRQRMRAWTLDPLDGAVGAPPIGRIAFTRCPIPFDDSGAPLAYLWDGQNATGTGVVACFAGVYALTGPLAGLLIAKTAELTATYGTTGMHQIPLAAVAGRSMVPDPGQDVLVARLIGSGTTTAPTFLRGNLSISTASGFGFDLATEYGRAMQTNVATFVDLPDALPAANAVQAITNPYFSALA